MTPELPISVYDFIFKALDSMTIPAYSGTLWHGVFGRSLKELSCIASGTPCQQCVLLYQCDYPYLFRRLASPDSEILRGKEVPVPHVFRFENTEDLFIKPGEQLTARLVIVGNANDKLPAVIRTMFNAGAAGFGENRIQSKLEKVRQTGPNSASIGIMEQTTLLANAQPQQPKTPNPPQNLRIKFITPYKPSGTNNKRQHLDIGRLLMAIVRRISLLQYFYTGKRLEADFPELKGLTESVTLLQQKLQWQNLRRYSASHGKTIDISGWVGQLAIELETSQQLWPYLWSAIICQLNPQDKTKSYRH